MRPESKKNNIISKKQTKQTNKLQTNKQTTQTNKQTSNKPNLFCDALNIIKRFKYFICDGKNAILLFEQFNSVKPTKQPIAAGNCSN